MLGGDHLGHAWLEIAYCGHYIPIDPWSDGYANGDVSDDGYSGILDDVSRVKSPAQVLRDREEAKMLEDMKDHEVLPGFPG